MKIITHKRGDTFDKVAQYTLDDGTPVDIANYEIKMQCRDKNEGLIFDVSTENGGIEKIDSYIGKFKVKIDDTSNFPIGKHYADIEYKHDGLTESSETFIFEIVKDITR